MNGCAHGGLHIATRLIQIERACLRPHLEAGKPGEEGERSRAICCLGGGHRRSPFLRSRCRCDGGGDGGVQLPRRRCRAPWNRRHRPSTEEQAAASEGGGRLRQSLRQRSETDLSERSSSGSLATTDALPLPPPIHTTNSSLESLPLGMRLRKIGLQPRSCWGCWGRASGWRHLGVHGIMDFLDFSP